MVQEPVNGGGGQCFGHDLVEAGGVQVARDGNRSAFVGSVDEAIESFGGVFRDREQTDVVDDDQVGADDPRQARAMESSARCRRTRAPRSSMVNQDTASPASTAACPSASVK